MNILTLNTNDAVKMLNRGSKVLSWHVVTELNIKPRKIVEEALDWAADVKSIGYLNAYREKFGKYPRNIRFAYIDKDIRIVSKDGAVVW